MAEALRLTLPEIRRHDAETEALAAQAPGQLRPGVSSPGAIAVAGFNGHLFIGEGANRWERQYLGRVTIEPDWFAAWGDLLAERRAEAARRGVPLWNIVVPEKQVVLAEERWAAPVPTGEGRPMRLLLDRLGPDCGLYYPDAALSAAKSAGPVYFVRNSHWTPGGCCVAVFGLLAAMGSAVADPEGVEFAYARSKVSHDLPPHFFTDPPLVNAGFLQAAGEYVFEHRPPAGQNSGSRYGVRNPAARDPRRVIVFGDSLAYDAGLTVALSAIFADVVFVWSKSVDWGAVEEYRADVVVWESAERFMATLPTT